MKPAKAITLLLSDDHAAIRHGLRSLLQMDGHFRVIGQAETGREAVALAAILQPDVILMDLAMPELSGLEATRQILAANPAAKVVILSAHSDPLYVAEMVAAGVAGYIEKQSSPLLLDKALRQVARGGTYFSPAIARRRRADSNPRRISTRV